MYVHVHRGLRAAAHAAKATPVLVEINNKVSKEIVIIRGVSSSRGTLPEAVIPAKCGLSSGHQA